MASKRTIEAIDLFCGAGGLTLAAQRLGIRVLAAVDNYRHACDTYEANFIEGRRKATRPVLYRRDLLNGFSPDQMQADLGVRIDGLGILMGGPPCQGYSTHRINDTGVDDPRNQLLLRYFAFVRKLRPKAFVVENVPGLLWPRHADYLRKFKAAASRAKYALHGPEVLNARDYGVPQNRKRVFIVGIRKDLDVVFSWPEPTHCNPTCRTSDGNSEVWLNASVVFGSPLPTGDPNAIHMQHSPALVEVFRNTPKNGGSRKDSGRELKCHKEHDGHKDVYGRIDPAKPGPTMTTACINPSKGRFVHPTENHGITVRHAARFQDFPDDFVFEGGLMAGGIQIGNAVPIGLGVAVIGAVTHALRSIPRRCPDART